MSSYYYNVKLKKRAWPEVYNSVIERPVEQYVLVQPEYTMENYSAMRRPFPPDVGVIHSKASEDDVKTAMEKAKRRNNSLIPGIICSITKEEFESENVPYRTKAFKERVKAEIASASKKADPR